MNEKEWIERFQLINHRNPRPSEYKEAKNRGEFVTETPVTTPTQATVKVEQTSEQVIDPVQQNSNLGTPVNTSQTVAQPTSPVTISAGNPPVNGQASPQTPVGQTTQLTNQTMPQQNVAQQEVRAQQTNQQQSLTQQQGPTQQPVIQQQQTLAQQGNAYNQQVPTQDGQVIYPQASSQPEESFWDKTKATSKKLADKTKDEFAKAREEIKAKQAAQTEEEKAREGTQQSSQQDYNQPDNDFIFQKRGGWLNLILIGINCLIFSPIIPMLEDGFFAYVVLIIAVCINLIPTLVSHTGWKYIIFICNIFLGPTIIGWIILYILALSTNNSARREQEMSYMMRKMSDR